jgi:hypothetical protein
MFAVVSKIPVSENSASTALIFLAQQVSIKMNVLLSNFGYLF